MVSPTSAFDLTSRIHIWIKKQMSSTCDLQLNKET